MKMNVWRRCRFPRPIEVMNQTARRYVVRDILHPSGPECRLAELGAVRVVQVVVWWRGLCVIEELLYLCRLFRGNRNHSLVFYCSIRVNWLHSTRSRFILYRCGCRILFLFKPDSLLSVDADRRVVSDIGLPDPGPARPLP